MRRMADHLLGLAERESILRWALVTLYLGLFFGSILLLGGSP